MRFASIASSSSGNCIYIGSERAHILVDAGISGKQIEQGLHELDLKGSDLDGIMITHEHSDHVKSLGLLARRYGLSIYGTKETLDELAEMESLGKISGELFHPIVPDIPVIIKDLEVFPFSVSHDAANPVAYRVKCKDKQVAIATDLGEYDENIISYLQGLDALLLEANHDVNMVQAGPYPYFVKRRILSSRGHLSNEHAGKLLNHLLHDRLKHILLGHLSKKNNYAALAYETVKLAIDMGDNPYQASDFQIEVAKRDEMSRVVNL